ncbi:MAG: hypothetical protein ABIN96_08115 [Rubrivivax sp.]
MSDLLEIIESRLKLASSNGEKAALQARKAIVLVRMAQFENAREIVASLRTIFDKGQDGRITCWIMLVEGLIGFFDGLRPEAEDRIRRANFLATAIGDLPLSSLTAAWKAHLEFERSVFEEMAMSLRKALVTVDSGDHDTLARIAIVMCNAYAVCGDADNSNIWFARGRDHAYRSGDRLSVDALIFNRAVYGLANARANYFSRSVCDIDTGALRMCVESARNLEALIGKTTLVEHLQLSHGRLLILEGHYEQAITCLSAIKGNNQCAEYNYNDSLIAVEIAYCYLKWNQPKEAQVWINSVKPGFRDKLDSDEVLVATQMLSELDFAGVDLRHIKYNDEEVEQANVVYDQMRSRLKAALIDANTLS